jgi:hypothetical protein
LWEIERFFEEHAPNGRARPDGLLGQDTGSRLFALGGYVGETIRRNAGGHWVGNASDLNDEINIAFQLPDGSVLTPVVRVMKRLELGNGESIVAYARSVGLDPGPSSNRVSTRSLLDRR